MFCLPLVSVQSVAVHTWGRGVRCAWVLWVASYRTGTGCGRRRAVSRGCCYAMRNVWSAAVVMQHTHIASGVVPCAWVATMSSSTYVPPPSTSASRQVCG